MSDVHRSVQTSESSFGSPLIPIAQTVSGAEDIHATVTQRRLRRLGNASGSWHPPNPPQTPKLWSGAYGKITEYGGQIARLLPAASHHVGVQPFKTSFDHIVLQRNSHCSNFDHPVRASPIESKIADRGWLPDVLSGNRVWKEQLVAEDLAMLFDAFEVDLEQELATPGCGGGFPQEIWGKCEEKVKLLGKMWQNIGNIWKNMGKYREIMLDDDSRMEWDDAAWCGCGTWKSGCNGVYVCLDHSLKHGMAISGIE